MKHARNIDAIVVQSAGLRKTESGRFAPTLYSDSDEFGMLGGTMRVFAAQELYRVHPNAAFVFCNGKSAKQIAKFGSGVPTDAEIYAEAFRDNIKTAEPKIFLEDKSVNTAASIEEILKMCREHGWKSIGLVSSDYHMARIEALCDLIFKKLGEQSVDITFISAEAALKALRPGMYDEEINSAYQTAAARKRIKNEEKGLKDIKSGKYHLGEFQLAPKD